MQQPFFVFVQSIVKCFWQNSELIRIGVLSTGLAYMLLQYLVANVGAVFAATSGNLIPVFAMLASYFLVGETINWMQVGGLGMILVGAWLVNRSPSSTEPVPVRQTGGE